MLRSRWDSLPLELQWAIVDAAGPLTQLLCGRASHIGRCPHQHPSVPLPVDSQRRQAWHDAFVLDWNGDLYLLPDCRLTAADVRLVASRSMYARLCARFPDDMGSILSHVPMRHGWLDLLHGGGLLTSESAPGMAVVAAQHGYVALLLHILDDLQGQGRLADVDAGRMVRFAARSGHMDVLALLAGRFPDADEWATNAMDHAAEAGHLDAMQWLHSTLGKGCTTRAMDRAAGGGHLAVVQWLHANRREGCTKQAMDRASLGGHLDVVQWLHAHRGEGCSALAIEWSVCKSRLAVLEFLLVHYPDLGCSQTAYITASANGFLGVMQLLHTLRPDKRGLVCASAMDAAATNGHLEMLVWLLETYRSVGCTAEAMDGAARNNHVHVVQWLHENRNEGCTPGALAWAAFRGFADMVRLLMTILPAGLADGRDAGELQDALQLARDWAVEGGHGDAILPLLLLN